MIDFSDQQKMAKIFGAEKNLESRTTIDETPKFPMKSVSHHLMTDIHILKTQEDACITTRKDETPESPDSLLSLYEKYSQRQDQQFEANILCPNFAHIIANYMAQDDLSKISEHVKSEADKSHISHMLGG